MSYLLAQWLKTLQLSEAIEPTNLDDKFRSGFLFGELLDKLEFQQAKGYTRGENVDILTNNYAKLEKTLRLKLGIKITLADTMNLISGKPGSAAKLLYQIKSFISATKIKDSKVKAKNIFVSRLESYPTSPIRKIFV